MTIPAASSHIPAVTTDSQPVNVGSLAERPDGDFLNLTDVAVILGTPVNTLRWWRQQGAGPHFFKIGRRLVTTVGDLRAWIEDQKHASGPGAA